MKKKNLVKEHTLIIRKKNYPVLHDVLIYDIETTKIDKDGDISPENSELRIWGAYSFRTNKVYYGYSGNSFQKLIDDYRIISGHNIKGFDNPIMEKNGVNFKYKRFIDTMEVMRPAPTKGEKESYEKQGKRPPTGKGRAKIIGEAQQSGLKDLRFPDFKLSTIAKHGYKIFGKNSKYKDFFKYYKDENFDYNILQPKWNNISDDNKKLIKEYVKKDLIVTRNIFLFLNKYFETMAEKLSDKDILNLEHINSPTGKYFYKAICYDLNLEEEYDSVKAEKFTGAYVYLPTQEHYGPEDGDGCTIDFSSQHPHHQWSGNLYTPISKCKHKINGKCPNPYSGDGEIFKLKGTYCACEMGPIEKWLRELYFGRVKFKCKFILENGEELKFKDVNEVSIGEKFCYIEEKTRELKYKEITMDIVKEAIELAKAGIDPRQYTYKILINSGFGVSSSPTFKSIYYKHCGPDTTRMSKQSTAYMDKWMSNKGYISTYSDTDSLYIMDPFRDKPRMIKAMKEGVNNIKKALPFPDPSYNMDVDAEFTDIFFIKDEKADKFKKKNYIYITKDNKVKLNGIPLIKANSPKIAKKIYLDYLEEEIKRTHNIKFEREWLWQLILFEIEKDKSILATNIKVKPAKNYAIPGCLQAQISERYFNGKNGQKLLIKYKDKKTKKKRYKYPNIGIGKGTRYCTIEESKQVDFNDLDLDTVWKVLDPFIKK